VNNLRMDKCILLVMLLKIVACQKDLGGATITYNPGQECLPYDGSVVPDCSAYVNPVTKEPYYKEHSSNCSRFWECGPPDNQGRYETCLFECAPCGGPSNPMCKDQWALTFDPNYQYPLGPVCDWPSNIECGVICDINDPQYECCHNDDCNQCDGGSCSLTFQCEYPEPCEVDCTQDSDCDHFDGECNVPAPHDPNNCAYCSDAGACLGGCGGLDNDANCPDGYLCNEDTHLCEEGGVCDTDDFCDGFNQTCNANYDNCFYCGGDCGSHDGCCPGCHDSALNCEHPTPVCNLATHTCGCTADADCLDGYYCEDNTCKPVCSVDGDCDGFDATCNVDTYENCFYCSSNETIFKQNECSGDKCCTGCANDSNCPYPTPVCHEDHSCGCNDDSDCKAGEHCNTDLDKCEAIPDECQVATEDVDCNGGVTGQCEPGVAEYIQCFYCDTDGTYNQCKPGCSNDNGEGKPECPATQPICIEHTHVCSQNPGATLLRQIVFTSESCTGCSTEGVDMILTGTLLEEPKPMCKTNALDNPQNIDYASKGLFEAEEQEIGWGWGTCYQSPLSGQVSAAEVTWVGEGTWTLDNVCFDWVDPAETKLVSICRNTMGASLSNGESATLECEVSDIKQCP